MAFFGAICKRLTVFGLATFLLILGILTAVCWNAIYSSLLKHELVITRNSRNYDIWKETPIPIYFSIYLFNWTNSEAVLKDWKIKPTFQECGPYVFSEHHIRVNMQWNDNNTVTYQQKRIWHFLPDKSNGTLQDNITNVNVVAATVGFFVRDKFRLAKMAVDLFLKEKERSLVITKTVDELLYKGYDDELLKMLNKLNSSSLNIPFDKFGWFYKRNGSETYDGTFTMFKGTKDIQQLGIFENWNGLPYSRFYGKECGKVNGSSGELWPPVQNVDTVSIFSPDICSKISLKHVGNGSIEGLEGKLYKGDDSIFDNGTKYPQQACFNTGVPVPSGARNISACRFGAPAFMSYPHFLYADESYRRAVVGMKPDKDLHGFTVLLEPQTGVPLDVRAALQLNIYLQPISHITMFSNIPKIFMPMLWFRQTATLTSEYASQVKVLLVLPNIFQYTGYGMIGLSLLFVVIGLFITFHNGWRGKEGQRLLTT